VAAKKGGKAKKQRTVDKFENAKWQKEAPLGDMKRLQFYGTPGVSNIIQSDDPLEIFELMLTNEIVDYITQQTNLYFIQNVGGKVFKPTSQILRHLNSVGFVLCDSNDIRLYIATILYRGIVQKPQAHMYFSQDKFFETPGFKRIMQQNKLILIEKYIHFVNISDLGNEYNRSVKIEQIHAYLVDHLIAPNT